MYPSGELGERSLEVDVDLGFVDSLPLRPQESATPVLPWNKNRNLGM
jgi:hypothetical protein